MANMSTSVSTAVFRYFIIGLVFVPALALTGAMLRTAEPRSCPDDPIWIGDGTTRDPSRVVAIEDSGACDFLLNTFGYLAHREPVRPMNVTPIDQVPGTPHEGDSSRRRATR
ncbi:MAG: hypothetical protein C5B57_07370 [Blastocatellia bacterium]|nr:MAG: hypothetical protein C5B57_07370 [Blastocatellia bacterium]